MCCPQDCPHGSAGKNISRLNQRSLVTLIRVLVAPFKEHHTSKPKAGNFGTVMLDYILMTKINFCH